MKLTREQLASYWTLLPAIAVIGAVQVGIPESLSHWHYVFQRLYYVPIVLAGLFLGWKGGLLAALCSAACYSLILRMPQTRPYDLVDDVLEVTIFCAVGLVTGILADREREQRSALETTSGELRRTYQRLQEHFEHMKRADRLSAIGHLSAGLAHEIRNPLASIEGAARLLQQQTPGEKDHWDEFLKIIQKECRRLNGLLTNFLDFAKPRAPALRRVSPKTLLESVVELARHGSMREKVTFQVDAPAHLPQVQCDEEQIKQVVLNLVINAIQSMPGGGEVTLRAQTREQSLLIQVQDAGSGIRAGDKDMIFNPFFTTKDEGTGLGLSVAHQIVEQHGGILGVDSTGESGTTISLVLPLRADRKP